MESRSHRVDSLPSGFVGDRQTFDLWEDLNRALVEITRLKEALARAQADITRLVDHNAFAWRVIEDLKARLREEA